MLVDVVFVLDELVLHALLQVRAARPESSSAVDHVLHKVETIQFVLHAHIEGSGDGAFFLVTPDVQVPIRSAIGQPVDQPGIAMKSENDVLVFGKQSVVVDAP